MVGTGDCNGTSIDDLTYAYDQLARVSAFGSTDGTADYGYDPTDQLISANYTTASGGHQPANESFSFDANGNRSSTGYTTGSDNLMSSDGTCSDQYDADGNMVSRTQIASTYSIQYLTTYSWDYRNRLTDVEYYDNNAVLTKHVHYVFDVFDHLLATEVDPNGSGTYTQIQHYVLDVAPEIPQAGVPGPALAQPVLQFDGDQSLTVRYLVGLDPTGRCSVVAQETVPSPSQGGQVIWAGDDNLGTPRDLVDNSGTLANHRVFSAFGEDVYDSDPSLSFWVGFEGGHHDANTELVNDYHRWYDPMTGRWLSSDPKGFRAGDEDLNRYVGNAPTVGVDPAGLDAGGGFWQDYWYYLWNPSQMDVELQAGQQMAIAAAAVAVVGLGAVAVAPALAVSAEITLPTVAVATAELGLAGGVTLPVPVVAIASTTVTITGADVVAGIAIATPAVTPLVVSMVSNGGDDAIDPSADTVLEPGPDDPTITDTPPWSPPAGDYDPGPPTFSEPWDGTYRGSGPPKLPPGGGPPP